MKQDSNNSTFSLWAALLIRSFSVKFSHTREYSRHCLSRTLVSTILQRAWVSKQLWLAILVLYSSPDPLLRNRELLLVGKDYIQRIMCFPYRKIQTQILYTPRFRFQYIIKQSGAHACHKRFLKQL